MIEKHTLHAAVVLLPALVATPAFTAEDVTLAPHRAVYDLALKDASDRSGIRSLRGRIVYEFTGSSCEGYVSRYRFRTNVNMGQRELENDQRSTVFESGDGKQFDFATQYFLNGQQEQDLSGSASQQDDGVAVKLTRPDEREIALEKAMFMNEHLKTIISKARDGERVLAAKVFDGSADGDELVDTTAIMGKEKPAGNAFEGEPDAVADQFAGTTGWPVSVSYFKPVDEEARGERLPDYQVSFLLHADGISRNLTMRYEDYAISGVLKQLDYLEAEPCAE